MDVERVLIPKMYLRLAYEILILLQKKKMRFFKLIRFLNYLSI